MKKAPLRLALAAIMAGTLAASEATAKETAPARGELAVEERSLADLSTALATGRTSARALVEAYLARIRAIDDAGPAINSVIAVNPQALAEADRLDAERRAGKARGPLHGIPLLIKDNIETADPMPTTAGSLALKDNLTLRDAPFVARLRAAGAIILGKTNLSEWANIRARRSTSGWSAVGGLTRNPYALDRNACGSSSGSGAAGAASLAAAAIGTETDGSITCPAAINGLVGLKPTVGLVSRNRIVPISHSQDTAGPMTRDVRDAALLLTAMAGSDPADPATAGADAHPTDYAARLSPDALKGKRIGVLRFAIGSDPKTAAVFETALADLRGAGATLIDIADLPGRDKLGDAETTVLITELKADLNTYLATTPPAVRTRTLADVIAFNRAHAAAEMAWFDQGLFEDAQATRGLDDPAYRAAREQSRRLAGPEGIDRLLRENTLDLLVAPTTGPAWTTDLVNGDHFGDGGAGDLAAVAGYPHLTVPMGLVQGLPVGLSFIGPAWSEAELLSAGYAYEQATHRREPPRYRPTATP
ncbi:amidase [Novosphingobium album (ex Liu et al. 2023)]|uniref:Amidase n=1 Tax=Novosphingobium album (ex Liu et al. 2023) TaxID=3031130 RepID=A0ABT5WR26_9SPHN|nr:amidase [Novosphingobium album (ex Liu et al. 2023)]MDE8652506.1 amidase [Novosphingobium album (ex Liu et al. 2023)]